MLLFFLLLTFSFSPVSAATGVPTLLHHQARLLDSAGNLLGGSAGTNYCFKFSLYDSSTPPGGTKLWPSGSPTKMTVNVKNGILNTDIGDTSVVAEGDTLDFDFNSTDEVYLNVQIANSLSGSCAAVPSGSYETLSPRERVVSAGYAINSKTVGGFTPSQTPTGDEIPVLNAGNLDIAGTLASGGLTLTLGSDATGDIFYRGVGGNLARLSIGADGKALVVSSGLPSWQNVGIGDALTTNPLSQFASTTSSELAGVISDETGSGSLVFAGSPIFTTPNIGNATGNISGNAETVTNGVYTTGADSIYLTPGTASSTYQIIGSYLTSLSGAVLTDQTTPQTIGLTGSRLANLWATDLTVTNAIDGSIIGNAGTAAALQTARNINGVSFDGTVDITIPSDITPGTSGNVLTSNGTIWTSATPASSGANTALSNLASVAINAPLATGAGTTLALSSTALTQISTAQAGIPVTLTASNAVAGSSVNGAATGGDVTITAGDAARLTSGNANGGSVILVAGNPVGSGVSPSVGFSLSGTVLRLYSTSFGSLYLVNTQSAALNSIGTTVFGRDINVSNMSGHSNTFFGASAGDSNTSQSNALTPARISTGGLNTFVGRAAGATSNAAIGRISLGYLAFNNVNNSAVIGEKGVTLLQLGSDSSDTQTARVIRAAGARAGTDTNIAGSPLTLSPGLGTGTAVGAALNLSLPIATTTGTTAHSIFQTLSFAGTTSLITGTVSAPAQAAASVAGNSLTLSASNAVAGSSVSGGAAGGNVTITAGNAARLTSGDANGGGVVFTTGKLIGSGYYGYFAIVGQNSSGNPGYSYFTSPHATSLFLTGGSVASSSTSPSSMVFNLATGALGSMTGSQETLFGYQSGRAPTAETNGLSGVGITSGTGNSLFGTYSVVTSATSTNRISIGAYAANNIDYSAVIGGKLVTLLQLGSDSSDTQTARVIRAAGARAGTDTDTAGSNLVLASGLGTGTSIPTSLLFQTPTVGTTGTTAQALATKMTINSTGVGIGVAPTYALDVLGTGTDIIARFNSTNATGCTLADGGTITCTSDVRMKKNIEDISYGLDTVMNFRPVLFNWKYESDGIEKNLGFIAQEIEAVVPKLVVTDENGMKSLNTTAMVPILTKAIQEMNLKIENVPLALTENKSFMDGLFLKVAVWMADSANDIASFVVKAIHSDTVYTKTLCVGDPGSETCLSQEQINTILSNVNSSQNNSTPAQTPSVIPTPDPIITLTSDPTITPVPDPIITPTPDPISIPDSTPTPTPDVTPTPEITPTP